MPATTDALLQPSHKPDHSMRRHWLSIPLFVALFALGRLPAHGAGIFDQLPAEATGFVAVHNLSAASEKVERVTAIFKELTPGPLPAPLALAKGVTGIGPGLNEAGDALLAFLPSAGAPFPPQPLMLLPVSDYAAFAEALGGDASGEICRVTISGEEVLLAKRGDFAALMNVEHRDQFERLLATTPAMPAELASLAEWLATTDLSIGLTRSGVERLAALGRRQAADQRQQAEALLNDPEESEALREIQRSMQAFDLALEFLGAEIKGGAVGLSIDDATNVKLAKRVILSEAGVLAAMTGAKPLTKPPLANFAADQFVVAGGGPLPPGFGDAFASTIRRFTEKLPPGRGYEGFTPEDWQKLEQSYQEFLKGLTSTSFVLYVGEKEEGLLSNYFSVAQADNANSYLQSFRRSLELDNELMAKAENDLSFPFELSETKVDDKPAVVAVADIGSAVDDPNVPGFELMVKSMVGPEGKFSLYAIAADDDTAVIGSASEEKLAKAVTFATESENGLAADSSVKLTADLLDPTAPWNVFVSPAGAVAWGGRAAQSFAAAFGGDLRVPPFPATAPIGMSLNLTEGQLRSELVAPVDLLKGIAEYAAKLHGK